MKKNTKQREKVVVNPNEITPTRKWYIENFKKKYLKLDMNQKLKNYFDSDENDINLSNCLHKAFDFSTSVFFQMSDESTTNNSPFSVLGGLIKSLGIVNSETNNLRVF